MTAGDICTRSVRTVSPGATVREATRRMKEHDVGCLVAVDRAGPVEGVVTDRDIVLRVVAEGLDPDTTPVSRVMSRGMIGIAADVPVERAMEVMAEQEVRRLVVTDDEGELVGVLSLDDVLGLLTEETDALHRLLRGQVGV